MSEEHLQEQLADDIYSKCGISIRYCDCMAIAQELIKLGWKKKFNGESRKEI